MSNRDLNQSDAPCHHSQPTFYDCNSASSSTTNHSEFLFLFCYSTSSSMEECCSASLHHESLGALNSARGFLCLAVLYPSTSAATAAPSSPGRHFRRRRRFFSKVCSGTVRSSLIAPSEQREIQFRIIRPRPPPPPPPPPPPVSFTSCQACGSVLQSLPQCAPLHATALLWSPFTIEPYRYPSLWMPA
ncbi:hypothetical protein IWX47DRAFT_120385 [Phyllosticta citricarpa]|uniref:Uncharacterized protein n=1 Tax=Phyllosticta citricarpa TaxID=55181 RepID=A0ABR1LQZ3_9PEZI